VSQRRLRKIFDKNLQKRSIYRKISQISGIERTIIAGCQPILLVNLVKGHVFFVLFRFFKHGFVSFCSTCEFGKLSG